jgi:hypothetical protein
MERTPPWKYIKKFAVFYGICGVITAFSTTGTWLRQTFRKTLVNFTKVCRPTSLQRRVQESSPLSAVRDCLFIICALPSIRNPEGVRHAAIKQERNKDE